MTKDELEHPEFELSLAEGHKVIFRNASEVIIRADAPARFHCWVSGAGYEVLHESPDGAKIPCDDWGKSLDTNK